MVFNNTKSAEALYSELPIGVFDSGVGGLTVLRELQRVLPHERFLYLGDTARLPYGTKSPDTIIRYSSQAAAFLLDRGIKCLVVACNTASAMALDVLRHRYPAIPIVGVVEPGAAAGCRASRSGRIAVIATEGTVNGGAYQQAISRLRPDARVVTRACPLLVPLAEEGWVDGGIVEAVLKRYLGELFESSDAPDTLLLGCTHFPVFRPSLRQLLGPGVTLVDSAATTATALVELLTRHQLLRVSPVADDVHFMATDGRERFARVAAHFLQRHIAPDAVELIDPAFALK